MTVEIRPAFEEDAAALAELASETFLSAFGHLYPSKDVDAFLAENHSVDVYRRLLADPNYGLWIAETAEGDQIGYAVAGPCSLPVPGLPPSSGELARLYLKKGSQGAGLGGRLLETALEFLEDRFDHVFLSVHSENYGAQRLYERRGFVRIAEYFYMVGEQADPDWIMELKSDAR